ncbi:MAG: hypothetical protein Q7S76_01965 [bacterium]|nr:hypothetical protein [bacterium]
MNRKEAIQLFVKASSDYPASVVAQAAAITIYCVDNDVSTNTLRGHLIHPNSLDAITKAANSRHQQLNDKSMLGSRVPLVECFDVLNIVTGEMNLADTFQKLSPANLRTILSRWPNDPSEEVRYRQWAIDTFLT